MELKKDIKINEDDFIEAALSNSKFIGVNEKSKTAFIKDIKEAYKNGKSLDIIYNKYKSTFQGSNLDKLRAIVEKTEAPKEKIDDSFYHRPSYSTHPNSRFKPECKGEEFSKKILDICKDEGGTTFIASIILQNKKDEKYVFYLSNFVCAKMAGEGGSPENHPDQTVLDAIKTKKLATLNLPKDCEILAFETDCDLLPCQRKTTKGGCYNQIPIKVTAILNTYLGESDKEIPLYTYSHDEAGKKLYYKFIYKNKEYKEENQGEDGKQGYSSEWKWG